MYYEYVFYVWKPSRVFPSIINLSNGVSKGMEKNVVLRHAYTVFSGAGTLGVAIDVKYYCFRNGNEITSIFFKKKTT